MYPYCYDRSMMSLRGSPLCLVICLYYYLDLKICELYANLPEGVGKIFLAGSKEKTGKNMRENVDKLKMSRLSSRRLYYIPTIYYY